MILKEQSATERMHDNSKKMFKSDRFFIFYVKENLSI